MEDIKTPVESLVNCPEHSDIALKYYCETCKKGICQTCSQSHSKHILYNLHALAQTIGEQISSIDSIYNTYQNIDTRYCTLKELLTSKANETKDTLINIQKYIEEKIQNWLHTFTHPINQMLADANKKKEEIELPLKAMKDIIEKKDDLKATLENSLRSGHYIKIYQLKDQIRSAFISQAQIESMKEKVTLYEKRYECEFAENINEQSIKQKISKIFDKLNEVRPNKLPWQSLIFNISPKATRAEIIDILKKQRRMMELNVQIEGFDTTILKRELYVVGGIDGNKTYLKDCLAFGIESEVYKVIKKSDIMIERIGHTVLCISKNYIYCAGGYNARFKYLNQCEKYDAYLNKWIAIPNLNEHKAQTSLCCLEERYLYSIGGSTGPTRYLKTLEVLELENEFRGWKVVEYRNTADKWQGMYCAGVVAISSYQIMIFGGMKEEKCKECYLFDKNTIEELSKALPQEASFYQRKPVVIGGKVYAPNSQNEVLTCIPTKNWSLMRVEDFALI